MRQLRLVGIHENGSSLQVSSDDGMSFELPVDDALRSAMAEIARARTPRNRDQSPDHSPREIQSRVRAGASAYDLSVEWDVPIEQILKYEGPVLAERAHIAELARRVEVSGPQTDAEYREAFGEEPADLGSMVSHRLGQLGIDPDNVEWDSWKDPEGQWMVTAKFSSPLHESNVESLSEGKQSDDHDVAKWSFHPQRRTLRNLNRWSQTLSEQAPPEYFSAITPVAVEPESEADKGDGSGESAQSEELVELLNARRGQRSGKDEGTDERLNEIIDRNLNKFNQDEDDEGVPHLPQTISTRTSQLTVVSHEPGSGEDKAETEDDANQRKSKRSSVPSWDDIMFGRRKKD
ncbi:septation protein SepH [Glutamicibacter sp. MNS18]|uniref:septation protein SepH n=1 Tax=Glutamicibacter sp. MNS18 TaxID=2989817 RepID=UPI0022359712|nr:septation protein SepH [Glutamicibacter sp. MNS18]MCW4464465.1 septation protein SepH [Glutamicibacter sp. MNS18]